MTERVELYPDAVFDITSRNVETPTVVFEEKNVTYNIMRGERTSIMTGREEVTVGQFRAPEDSSSPIGNIDGTDVRSFTVVVEKVVTVAGPTDDPHSAELDAHYLYTVYSAETNIEVEDLRSEEVDDRIVSVMLSYTTVVPIFLQIMVQ